MEVTMETATTQQAGQGGGEPPAAPVIKLEPLRKALNELDAAHTRLVDARLQFRSLVDALAAKTNLASSVIRALANTRNMERSDQAARKVEQARQLSMVFDELGT
jgi:two-component sensor histidine kinase